MLISSVKKLALQLSMEKENWDVWLLRMEKQLELLLILVAKKKMDS
jgi:hypothetical protein